MRARAAAMAPAATSMATIATPMSTTPAAYTHMGCAQVAQMRARADAMALEEVMRQEEAAAKQSEEARRRARQVCQTEPYIT